MIRASVVLVVLLLAFNGARAHESAPEIRTAVVKFVDRLTPDQRAQAMLGFADSARSRWNNLPVGLAPRAGLNIGSMTDEQRKLLHRILSSSLSSQGYLKATGIMHLDNLLELVYDSLHARGGLPDSIYRFVKTLKWSHKNYYLAIFGDPRTDSTWGYKLEGHHLSINFTIDRGHVAVTPMFVGTDPAEYPSTEYAGWRVLAYEEDYGITLLRSLTPAQQKKATMSKEVPGDIITSASSGKRLVDLWGIPGSEMNANQKSLMQKAIREFVFNLEYDRAVREYDKIVKAGFDRVYFGWIGEYDEEKPHYYILNGPTFLIEFDNNGGPRHGANHIHAIWREKGNEYGEDLLKEHYEMEHH
jgi:hypothetical protein